MEYTLKKSLGQHFLRDEQICQKIVAALEAPFPPAVLEVGPGDGALTKYLIERQDLRLKCIEVDEEQVRWLLPHYPALQGKLLQ
ncbi:MAG: rRNA adenine N-6-methyltransferase family protein, partial [Chitinophagaceae bacterium]